MPSTAFCKVGCLPETTWAVACLAAFRRCCPAASTALNASACLNVGVLPAPCPHFHCPHLHCLHLTAFALFATIACTFLLQGITVEALPVSEADGLVWVWPGRPEVHAEAGPPPPLARPPPGFEVRLGGGCSLQKTMPFQCWALGD